MAEYEYEKPRDPTLSELAGLSIPESVHGTSLLPILKDPAASVKSSALSFHNGASLRNDDWHYMRYDDGTAELYDMRKDPQEFINLASLPAYADRVQELDAQLVHKLSAKGMEFPIK